MATDHKPLAAVAWKIRPFHADDGQAISDIVRDSAEAAQWPPESYAKLANSNGGIVLVCVANDLVAGFVAARKTAGEAEILNIALHSAFRRKGIPSALLPPALHAVLRPAVAPFFLRLRA